MRDQIGCPTYTGHLAAGLVRLLDGEDYGIHHMAGGGRCSWYDFAVEIFSQAGRRLPRAVDDQRHARPARPRGRPYSVLVSEREHPVLLPDWQRGPRRLPRRARGGVRREAARHRRRRVHRLELRAPLPRRAPGRQRGRARQAHLRRPPGVAPGPDDLRAHGVRAGRHRRSRRPCATRSRAATRCQLRGRVARRPLDRGAGALHPDRRVRDLRAARGGPRRRRSSRYVQVSTDEVYGSIEEGSFTEQSPLDPSSPYSASKAGGDLLGQRLLPHLRHGRDRLPRLQQLRPLPVPGEADPAVRAERAARRPAARVRRRHAGAQLAPRDRPLPRPRRGPARRQGRRDLQHRRPGRAAEHRRRAHDPAS